MEACESSEVDWWMLLFFGAGCWSLSLEAESRILSFPQRLGVECFFFRRQIAESSFKVWEQNESMLALALPFMLFCREDPAATLELPAATGWAPLGNCHLGPELPGLLPPVPHCQGVVALELLQWGPTPLPTAMRGLGVYLHCWSLLWHPVKWSGAACLGWHARRTTAVCCHCWLPASSQFSSLWAVGGETPLLLLIV